MGHSTGANKSVAMFLGESRPMFAQSVTVSCRFQACVEKLVKYQTCDISMIVSDSCNRP